MVTIPVSHPGSIVLHMIEEKFSVNNYLIVFFSPQGFVASVSHLRATVPAIYDITLAIPKDKPRPTLLRMLRGCSSVVSSYLRTFSLSNTDIVSIYVNIHKTEGGKWVGGAQFEWVKIS